MRILFRGEILRRSATPGGMPSENVAFATQTGSKINPFKPNVFQAHIGKLFCQSLQKIFSWRNDAARPARLTAGPEVQEKAY